MGAYFMGTRGDKLTFECFKLFKLNLKSLWKIFSVGIYFFFFICHTSEIMEHNDYNHLYYITIDTSY